MGAVISAIKQPFKDNGLSVVQPISGDGATVTITTVLMHSSGEWISTSIAMSVEQVKGKTLVQELGSIITYLRRYSLASMAGVYSDQDTDGNDPNAEKSQNKSEKSSSSTAKTAKPETKKQVVELCKKLGGSVNEPMMVLLKEYDKSGNPNKVEDEEKLQELLVKLEKIVPVEKESTEEKEKV
jgi:hypothetical protein